MEDQDRGHIPNQDLEVDHIVLNLDIEAGLGLVKDLYQDHIADHIQDDTISLGQSEMV